MSDHATPAGDLSPWTILAHILRPQGRKGEVLAELLTDFPERFKTNKRVFLAPQEFSGSTDDARVADVAAFWLPKGKNEGRIVLHLEGVDSITTAEQLAGLDVIVPTIERVELDEDSSYISDLIGCTVYDHADPSGIVAVGTVDDIHFATSPDGNRRLEEAAPLLSVVSSDGDEVLIPFAKAFLLSIDPVSRRIDMNLPEGLVAVNRAS